MAQTANQQAWNFVNAPIEELTNGQLFSTRTTLQDAIREKSLTKPDARKVIGAINAELENRAKRVLSAA